MLGTSPGLPRLAKPPQLVGVRFSALLRFLEDFLFDDFLFEDFLGGTLSPSRRASDSPIAIACLGLRTLREEAPLFNVPALRLRIARPTLADAFLEYFRAIVDPPGLGGVITILRDGSKSGKCNEERFI